MKPALSLSEICAAIPEAMGALLMRVVDCAASADVRIHLVGGPVRDLLLGRSVEDVDLMVEGDARGLADTLVKSAAGSGLQVVAHDRFGTVRIESAEARIDLAGLRHDTYSQPGALPDVEAGSLEQDVHRRDFAVNALLCPLDASRPDHRQPILDLEGGLEDLKKKRLRILHPRSFHDDPTRAWRAARFAVRLGFSLDRSSRNALRNALRDGAFGAVSGERFRRELQIAFDEAHRGVHVGHTLRLLSDWHVLAALEPGLVLRGEQLPALRKLAKAIAEPEWPTAKWRGWVAGLSIALAPLPAALRRRALDRLSIRGEQATRIRRFGRESERTLKALARARGRGAVDATLGELPEEGIQAIYALADASVRRRMLRWGAEDRRRRAPVAGGDLIELGLTGPDVGKALARIRGGFLDGDVANREEALALALEIARRTARRKPRDPLKRPRRKVAQRSVIADTPAGRGKPSSPGTDSVSPPDSAGPTGPQVPPEPKSDLP